MNILHFVKGVRNFWTDTVVNIIESLNRPMSLQIREADKNSSDMSSIDKVNGVKKRNYLIITRFSIFVDSDKITLTARRINIEKSR